MSGYWLMDSDSANMVGYYRSRRQALLAVKEAITMYGADSPEVCSLVLAADLPPQEGTPLQGKALIAAARAV